MTEPKTLAEQQLTRTFPAFHDGCYLTADDLTIFAQETAEARDKEWRHLVHETLALACEYIRGADSYTIEARNNIIQRLKTEAGYEEKTRQNPVAHYVA